MVVLLAGVGSVVAELRRRAPGQRGRRTLRAGLVAARVGSRRRRARPPSASSSPGWRSTALGLGVVDAAVATCRRWRSSTATGARSCRRSTAPGPPAASSATLVTLATSAVAGHRPRCRCSRAPAAALAAPLPAPRPRRAAADRPRSTCRGGGSCCSGWRMVLFYMVDTAATTWGPVYLDGRPSRPDRPHRPGDAPLPRRDAWPPGSPATASSPGYGAVWLLRIGAVVAARRLAVIVFAPDVGRWPSSGSPSLGGGVAVIAPLSFSAAAADRGRRGRLDPASASAGSTPVIARFNQFNYVGALLGAVLTGAVGLGQPAPRLRRADGAHPGDPPARRRLPRRPRHAAYLMGPRWRQQRRLRALVATQTSPDPRNGRP